MKKRISTVLFTVVCVLGLLSATVFAADAAAQSETGDELQISWEYVSPQYEGLNVAWTADVPADTWAASVDGVEYLTTEEEAVSALREHFVNRDESFQFYYRTEEGTLDLNELFKKAQEHTGNPKEGDSLRAAVGRCTVDGKGFYSNGKCYWPLTFTMEYDANREQEQVLDQKVAEVLKKLNLQGKSDYEKVCAIYDYICDNVTYDYDHLDDSSYQLKYSAYAALVNGTSVCEGYAALFYRMALEAGLDARMIVYNAQSGGHAWNIVRIGDLYYNVDSTWDASWYHYGYEYFLRCDATFEDHTPNEEFTTSEFCAQYPKSQTDYRTLLQSGYCGNIVAWELYDNGELALYGDAAVDDYETAEDSPLWEYRDQITAVSIKDDVTAIGDRFFGGCDELTEVTIPASVTAIGSAAFSGANLTDVYFLGDAPAAEENSFAAEVTLWYDPDTSGWTTPEWNGFRAYPGTTDLSRSGLYQDADGVWRYYANGKVDTKYTDLVEYYGNKFYVANGVLDNTYTGLVYDGENWCYVSGGMQNMDYTGLVYSFDNWYYVSNGVVNWTTGLVDHFGTLYYVSNGAMDTDYAGLVEYNGQQYYAAYGAAAVSYTGFAPCGEDWYYVVNGIVAEGYSGLLAVSGSIYYVVNGRLDTDYAGLVESDGTKYYVTCGVVAASYTGLALHEGGWCYVTNGVLAEDYTGLLSLNGSIYYVVNGALANYSGLVEHGGDWYYVSGGIVADGYTGLALHEGSWYYVSNGVLDTVYVGLVESGGRLFYVTGGVVNWGFSGTVDGYRVENGMVVG